MDQNETPVTKVDSPHENDCQEKHGAEEGNSSASASNINSDQIDKETMAKLRGDAIGDTMYSESFVIKTLLHLSDMTWSEKIEEDLCFLWDMTVEEDVCKFLYKLSFPSLASAALVKYEEPRLIEIIIGTLANITCCKVPLAIKPVDTNVILGWLDTDDHLILIQIMRFINGVAYKNQCQSLSFITKEVMDKISFILNNSMDKELLLLTLDVVSQVTEDSTLGNELVMNGALLKASGNAYHTILNTESYEDAADGCERGTELEKALTSLVDISSNICARFAVQDGSQNEPGDDLCDLTADFSRIISHFSHNLLPLNENFKAFIGAFTLIFPILSVPYDSKMFTNLCNAIQVLRNTGDEDLCCCIELLCYFISVGNVQDLGNDLCRCCGDGDALQILNLTLETKGECGLKFEQNVNTLLSNYREGK